MADNFFDAEDIVEQPTQEDNFFDEADVVSQEAPVSEPVDEGISQGESLARGAGQGVTLGFADELGSAAYTAFDKLRGLLGGDSQLEVAQQLEEQGFKGDIGPTSVGEAYEETRDELRAADEAAQEENPWSYGAGEVAGALALPVGELAGATKAGKAFAGSKHLDKLGKTGKAMAIAAPKVGIETAAYSAGQAEELEDVPEALTKGFAGGAAMGAALPVAGKFYGDLKEGAKGIGKQIMKYASDIDPRIIDDVFENPTLLKDTKTFNQLADEVKEAATGMKTQADEAAKRAKDLLGNDEVFSSSTISSSIRNRAKNLKMSETSAFKDLERVAKEIDTRYAGNMSQRQLQEVLDELSNMAYKGVKKDAPGAVADQLRAVRGELSDILKKANPEYRKAMSEAERGFEALNKVKSKFGIEDVKDKTFNEFGEVTEVVRGLDYKGQTGKDAAINKIRGLGKVNKESVKEFLQDPEIQKYLKLGDDFIQEGKAAEYIEELDKSGVSTKVLTGIKTILGAQILGPVGGAAAILAPVGGRELVKSPKAIMAAKAAGLSADKVAKKFGETFARPIVSTQSTYKDKASTMKFDSAKLEESSGDELTELSNTMSQFGKAGEGYSRVLEKASQQDEGDRKRTLFGLQQQPAFRELLKRIEDEK